MMCSVFELATYVLCVVFEAQGSLISEKLTGVVGVRIRMSSFDRTFRGSRRVGVHKISPFKSSLYPFFFPRS